MRGADGNSKSKEKVAESAMRVGEWWAKRMNIIGFCDLEYIYIYICMPGLEMIFEDH